MTSCVRCLCVTVLLLAGLIVLAPLPGLSGVARAAGGPAQNETRLEPRVVLDAERNTAEIVAGAYATSAALSRAEAAVQFIADRVDLFRLEDPAAELELISRQADRLNREHLRYQQEYRGLRVWGCQKIVHFSPDREIYLVAGQTIPTPDISVQPGLEESDAITIAEHEFQRRLPSGNRRLETELIIYPQADRGRLAWLVTAHGINVGAVRWRVFVDARTGELLHSFNDIHFDGPAVGSGTDVTGFPRTLQTYQVGSAYRLIDATHPMYVPPVENEEGVVVTYDDYYSGGSIIEDPNGDNVFDDNMELRAAVSGHYYTQLTYEYYLATHGRDSYDGQGSMILVNVHDPVYTNNAYWNGQGINFADGDGVNYLPFSGSLDVVAHELTHGVTDYTANLIYQFQSGALNESFSDFFGAMVDRDDWLLGEEIRLTSPGFIRSMINPNLTGQPAHMDEFRVLPIDTDNGGVHINSGIPNRAGYLASTASSREATERIWYRTLTTYLTPSSDMAFWAGMTVQSAVDLFGLPSAEVTAVANALDSVGLGGTTAQPSRFAPLAAALGEVADTTILLRNLSSQPVQILTATTTRSEFSLGGPLPVTLNFGDTITYQLSFDASALTSTCDMGQHEDTLVFTTSSTSYPTVTVPITVSLGHSAAAPASSAFTTDCAVLTAVNDPAIESFVGSGVDALYRGSLLIGVVNGGDTTVYWNLYEGSNFATVDNYAADLDPQGRQTQTVRMATGDGRLHGSVTYTYRPTGAEGCAAYLVDYMLHNDCDTALTITTGVFTDFDIISSGTNRAFPDAARELVYMRDAADSWAAGWALLSGSAQNRRAVNNPAWIYPGWSQAEAYTQMASTLDVSSSFGDDWSVLLTFDEELLLPGDTISHRAALAFSDEGTAGLQAVVDSLRADVCQIDVAGDVDLSLSITSADVIWLVNHIFKGGLEPLPCAANGDLDCSGALTAADIIYAVNYVFKGGDAPCDICGMVPGIWSCP